MIAGRKIPFLQWNQKGTHESKSHYPQQSAPNSPQYQLEGTQPLYDSCLLVSYANRERKSKAPHEKDMQLLHLISTSKHICQNKTSQIPQTRRSKQTCHLVRTPCHFLYPWYASSRNYKCLECMVCTDTHDFLRKLAAGHLLWSKKEWIIMLGVLLISSESRFDVLSEQKCFDVDGHLDH